MALLRLCFSWTSSFRVSLTNTNTFRSRLACLLESVTCQRIDTSARHSRNSDGGGRINGYSSDGGKHAQLRFEAVRLSRLHVDTSNDGGGSGGCGEGGESAPPSPTSFGAGRRLSRLWVGSRRQSRSDGRDASPSPTIDRRDKVEAMSTKALDMCACHGCGICLNNCHLLNVDYCGWWCLFKFSTSSAVVL